MTRRTSLRRALLPFLALAASPLGAQPAARLRPFTVTGRVLDTRGRPLEGAEILVRADFVYGRASTTSDRDGRYVITDLIRATYRADAQIRVPYAGSTVCQRLAMPKATDYNSFPVSSGAVRDFRWQLTGRMGTTTEFFGAWIRIILSDVLSPRTARAVEFTLVPTGPLVDGSAGATIVREAPLSLPGSDWGFDDVPLGTYRLRAVLVDRAGGRTPLVVAPGAGDEFASEIEVVWEPFDRYCAGPASGVMPFTVKVERAR